MRSPHLIIGDVVEWFERLGQLPLGSFLPGPCQVAQYLDVAPHEDQASHPATLSMTQEIETSSETVVLQ